MSIAGNRQVVTKGMPAAREVAEVTACLMTKSFLLKAGLEQILSRRGFVISDAPARHNPGLVIIEASTSLSETVEAVAHIKGQYPDARIAVLAESFGLQDVMEAREAGADGFCLLATAPEVLTTSLELIMLGELIVPSALLRSVVAGSAGHAGYQASRTGPALADLDPRFNKLSPREGDVLRSLMGGASNKHIARQFDLAEATVKVHVKSILRKIGATNRTQAAIWATDHMPAAQHPHANH